MLSLVLNILSHQTENIKGAVALMLGRAHRKPKSVGRTAEGHIWRRKKVGAGPGRGGCGRSGTSCYCIQESNQRCPWMDHLDPK